MYAFTDRLSTAYTSSFQHPRLSLHFNLLFFSKRRSRSHSLLNPFISWDYYKIGKKALFHKISRKYIDIYMYMYILSRVFLPRVLSPLVAVISRSTFYFVLSPLLAYKRKSKAVDPSVKHVFRGAFLRGKAKRAQKVRKDISDQTPIEGRIKTKPRKSALLGSRCDRKWKWKKRDHAKGKRKRSTPAKDDYHLGAVIYCSKLIYNLNLHGSFFSLFFFWQRRVIKGVGIV